MFIVVFYDVPAKRTEIYRKLLSRYLNWMQNSVFSGDITEAVYKKMRYKIKEVVKNDDRLAFITTDNRHNIDVELLEKGQSISDDSHRGSGVL